MQVLLSRDGGYDIQCHIDDLGDWIEHDDLSWVEDRVASTGSCVVRTADGSWQVSLIDDNEREQEYEVYWA